MQNQIYINRLSKVICFIYNSVVSSVLEYGFSSWVEGCGKNLERQARKITEEEIHALVEIPSKVHVYEQKCLSLIHKL